MKIFRVDLWSRSSTNLFYLMDKVKYYKSKSLFIAEDVLWFNFTVANE